MSSAWLLSGNNTQQDDGLILFFNSFTFFIFFAAVFLGYLLLRHREQNWLLLAASCFFYGAWDYRFLLLLFLTITIDYWAAKLIYETKDSSIRKRILFVSIIFNLGILFYFKYANFFLENAIIILASFGIHVKPVTLNILLPVGISFYTFQSMSYTVDVFRRRINPTEKFTDYALYVSFFPQLVAGPIERGTHLLPQILLPRTISFAKIQLGFYYICSGLFLKVFLADNLARLVDPIFAAHQAQTGFCYLLTGYAFAFQIYGDFAGYSWMAKGLGAMLGFEIMDNFNLPYFSKNPQDFWRRWHISLSSWLRDYLYIPLGGNRGGRMKVIRNLFITMLLGGLWHGANMTFIVWGIFHALILAIYHIIKNKKILCRTGNFIKIIFFFHVIVISWYFFRAENFSQIEIIFSSLCNNFHFDIIGNRLFIIKILFYISPVVFMQTIQYITNNQLVVFSMPIPARALIYCIGFYLFVIFGVTHAHEFIYFQF